MGQEIDNVTFEPEDFEHFEEQLKQETKLFAQWCRDGEISDKDPIAGFEIEAWLINKDLTPAPINDKVIDVLPDALASPELALFNLELNNEPKSLAGQALGQLYDELTSIWQCTHQAANKFNAEVMTIGILPTLEEKHLDIHYMSPLKRYQALNEQVLRSRKGVPLKLDIVGDQHLCSTHNNFMMEAATTSFQIHLQSPFHRAHQLYNASIAVSAPIVAASANSPYLFSFDLWQETRIPLFEQSVEIGGFGDVAHGPLRRVSFGTSYARDSITECFEENLRHFPVLLPASYKDEPNKLRHLRLHNGTIWRWNRPLVGFDKDGLPHIRIEHRVIAGNPSIADAIANAAFYYGLVEAVSTKYPKIEAFIPFAQAKDNFYQAARNGLSASLKWHERQKIRCDTLIIEHLIPLAREGLNQLGIDAHESDHFLNIVLQRVECRQNGSAWQHEFVHKYGKDMRALTAAYLDHQRSGKPVHEW